MKAPALVVAAALTLLAGSTPAATQSGSSTGQPVDAPFPKAGTIRMTLSAGDYRISGRADDRIRVAWRADKPENAANLKAAAEIRRQLREKPGATMSVDLEAQTVVDPSGKVHRFDIQPVRKKCLLEGLDDVSRTQQYAVAFA